MRLSGHPIRCRLTVRQPASGSVGRTVPMDRIYFDENAGDARGRYDLGIPGSRQDLERLSAKLGEGVRVMLYDGQEIEIEAVLEFDRSSNRWMALPLWDTIRRRDEKHKWPDVAE
jgi:hypothetical protein